MNKVSIKEINVIGIAVRTTNENSQAAKDIGALWNKFMSEDILELIPNKIDHSIYSIYTDYESDHTKPYTTILGCKVSNTEQIPDGMVLKTIPSGSYTKYLAKGDLTKDIVYNKWVKIWNSAEDRIYTTDFEVYGEKAQNPTNAEVDIYLATK